MSCDRGAMGSSFDTHRTGSLAHACAELAFAMLPHKRLHVDEVQCGAGGRARQSTVACMHHYDLHNRIVCVLPVRRLRVASVRRRVGPMSTRDTMTP
jgi:hypothetical protein